MRPETVRLLGIAATALALVGVTACGQLAPTASPLPPGATASAGTAASAGPVPTAEAGASAGPTAPTGSAAPGATPASKSAPACDAVLKARQTALAAIAPVAAVLAQPGRPHETLAKATNDLNTAYTAMHVGVAGAAELTADPQLKAKISAYQLAVEQAIVAVEGSDGEQAKLAAVIELPATRSAERAVVAACS
ncbi:hypothetical protein ACFQZ4_47895 [Catellatospora coxensis]|uniref:Lipoprotein n=1 Tax=Catellatospora coxensis TaxID=310354 RepID=A0A8J3P4H5_9ACTN|nr:hypothetical protein [Catellatospora coxensis]GIG03828.1 hypothetical protein Cco03nite_05280 [Catellatospora coxensis]